MASTATCGAARGTVAAPRSKSQAHRLLICAALADGESNVRGVDRSEDILATADCLAALGASLTWEGDDVRIRGCDPRKSGPAVLRCRESGSTLRFMIPLCLLSGNPMRLEGSETLLSRPLSVYDDLCREQGLALRRENAGLLAEGCLAPGEYTVPGGISSQFITGLLFALPLLPADSRIQLIPPVESRSYLSLTLQALHDAGVDVSWADENTLFIPGGAAYRPLDTEVEGDYSNAAFFEALNCTGGNVTVTGLRPDSLQGDRVYREFFPRLSAENAELDLADCPDLAPVLFAAAVLGRGVQLISEENRITVPAAALRAPSEPLDSHNDHRIAMALSLLCTRTGGEIRGAEAVRKSFPDYWDRLRSLGIEIEIRN